MDSVLGHPIRHARSGSSSRASPPQVGLLDDDDDEMMAQLFPDLPRYDSAVAYAKGRRHMPRAARCVAVAVAMVAIRRPAILVRCRRRVHVDPTSPYDTCNFLLPMPLHVDELRII